MNRLATNRQHQRCSCQPWPRGRLRYDAAKAASVVARWAPMLASNGGQSIFFQCPLLSPLIDHLRNHAVLLPEESLNSPCVGSAASSASWTAKREQLSFFMPSLHAFSPVFELTGSHLMDGAGSANP